MSLDSRVLDVIQSFYDAALDETRWPQVLPQLTSLTGSEAATFWVLDSQNLRLPTFSFINFDPVLMQVYLDQLVGLDPFNPYLAAHPEAAIVHDGLVITEREKDHHAY
jgi:hypothetical protein